MIEACACNIDREHRAGLSDLAENVRIYPCLEHCGICHRTPFLVVDGELEQAPDHESLIERLNQR